MDESWLTADRQMSMSKRSAKLKRSPISSNDPSVQITLKAVLCHALRMSGFMTEALQMNIEATESADEIVKFDRQTFGFDVEIWLTVMRGQTLVMLGRGMRLVQSSIASFIWTLSKLTLFITPSRVGHTSTSHGWRETSDWLKSMPSGPFSIHEKRQPLYASLWSRLSWRCACGRKKAHLGDTGALSDAQLRAIAKGWLGKRTPNSCRFGKCLPTERRHFKRLAAKNRG